MITSIWNILKETAVLWSRHVKTKKLSELHIKGEYESCVPVKKLTVDITLFKIKATVKFDNTSNWTYSEKKETF